MNFEMKYRPESFDDYFGHEAVVKIIKSYIRKNALPANLGFTGAPGTGKDSLARLIVSSYLCTHKRKGAVNPCPDCSGKSIDGMMGCVHIDCTILTCDELKHEISVMSSCPMNNGFRFLIFNEFSELKPNIQKALRHPTTAFTGKNRFIYCMNDENKLDTGMKSRIQLFHLKRPEDKELVKYMEHIAQREEVQVENQMLAKAVRHKITDFRSACQFMEQLTSIADRAKEIRESDINMILGLSG